MTAENIVPKIWWRDGFANDLLLLSHNDSELPRKMLTTGQLRNKRLKNMYQCVSRQVFIRESFDLQEGLSDIAEQDEGEIRIGQKGKSKKSKRCKLASEPAVKRFYVMWSLDNDRMLGGEWRTSTGSQSSYWWPKKNDLEIRTAANLVNILPLVCFLLFQLTLTIIKLSPS